MQNSYTPTDVKPCTRQAWKMCRQSNWRLRVHLHVESATDRSLIWQEGAPVHTILFDSPRIMVREFHLVFCQRIGGWFRKLNSVELEDYFAVQPPLLQTLNLASDVCRSDAETGIMKLRRNNTENGAPKADETLAFGAGLLCSENDGYQPVSHWLLGCSSIGLSDYSWPCIFYLRSPDLVAS